MAAFPTASWSSDAGHTYWTNMSVPNDQVVMSKTPGFISTVLVPRDSSKSAWPGH